MKKTDVPLREKHSRIEGGYMEQEHTPHVGQCFVMGNNKIIINEYFRDDGKPLESILVKVIRDAGKCPKSA